jgi:hypothetical protein
MQSTIRAAILTILSIFILVMILRFHRRSLALFTLHKEGDTQEQIENFFKYNISLGIVTVVLALIGLSTFLPPWFSTYESEAVPFILITIGSVSSVLGGVFAAYLLVVSLRVSKDAGLNLTDGERLAVRKGMLLAGTSLVIMVIAAVPVAVYLLLYY